MIERVCPICHKKFLKRGGTTFCSRQCYRKTPKMIKWQREYDRSRDNKVRRLKFWNSPAGRAQHRIGMSKQYLYKIVDSLSGKRFPRNTQVQDLYVRAVMLIKNNPEKAKRKFPGGDPDAKELRVEFKIGLDSLRSSQFVQNALSGHKNKIRWFPSYDSVELLARGGENGSKLFNSYLEYLIACEKSRCFDLKEN